MESVFLTIDLDDDGLPTAQTAIAASAVATTVSAAPAGVSYVTSGAGDNV